MLIIESTESTTFIYVNYIKKLSRVARINKCDESFSILFDIVEANNYNNIVRYVNKDSNDRRVANVSVRLIVDLISATRIY